MATTGSDLAIRLLEVIRLQHEALVSVEPLLVTATGDIGRMLERHGIDLPIGAELRLVQTAIALGAGVLEHAPAEVTDRA